MKIFKHLIFGDNDPKIEKPVFTTDEEYKRKAEEVLETSWKLLNSTDNWRLEKQNGDGDTVYSKYIPGLGKVFKLTAEVNFPPKMLMNELFYKIHHVPQWNPIILESRQIQKIDDNTDVSYQLTADYGGGLFRSREFVSVRILSMRDGCYISAGAAVSHPAVPHHKKYIRGENGPNCWVYRPIPGIKDRCQFQWLLNTNVHGWLPQYVVDASLTNMMMDYTKYLRKYGLQLRQEGKMDL